jgi:hypothetical protein
MRWNDLKTVIVEAGEKVRITITFESGVRININNVPKTVTTMPNFEETVQAAAQKAKPNETYSSWSIGGGDERSGGDFVPTEAEEEAINNCRDLYRLIDETMTETIGRGIESAESSGKPLRGMEGINDPWYKPRAVDPKFPEVLEFEYTINGENKKINVLDTIPITTFINTRNPKRDEFGVVHEEGWPTNGADYDEMSRMIIDTVGAKEYITFGMQYPEPDGNVQSDTNVQKRWLYKRAIVYNTGDN